MQRRRSRAENESSGPGLEKKVRLTELQELARTLKDTGRNVRKSRTVQGKVRRQVAGLRNEIGRLGQVEEKLKSEKRELQDTIDELRKNQKNLDRFEQQLNNYKLELKQSIERQIEKLNTMNRDMKEVSDSYLELIEPDAEKKAVYVEYFSQLLEEADLGAVVNVQDEAQRLVELPYAQVKGFVERLELLLENDDDDNFPTQVTNLLREISADRESKQKKLKK
uniref:Uncharacterized protein n=1 Tax=viral metagenome TaxID=1070528 RepID=A0A6C0BPI1_9ZZZZ